MLGYEERRFKSANRHRYQSRCCADRWTTEWPAMSVMQLPPCLRAIPFCRSTIICLHTQRVIIIFRLAMIRKTRKSSTENRVLSLFA